MTPFERWIDGLDWGEDETDPQRTEQTEEIQLKLFTDADRLQ